MTRGTGGSGGNMWGIHHVDLPLMSPTTVSHRYLPRPEAVALKMTVWDVLRTDDIAIIHCRDVEQERIWTRPFGSTTMWIWIDAWVFTGVYMQYVPTCHI